MSDRKTTLKQTGIRISAKKAQPYVEAGILVEAKNETVQSPLKPYYNQVVVVEEELPSQTASGIYIPETARESKQIGLVIAVGPGYIEHGVPIPCMARPGVKVTYHKNAGHKITLNEKEYLVLRDTEIFGEIV